MRPVFNKEFRENMAAMLYAHSLDHAIKSLELMCNVLANASKKNVVTVTHIMSDSDTLRSVSSRYYGTPSYWRKLAIYNKLDTTEIDSGTQIEIPEKRMLDGI